MKSMILAAGLGTRLKPLTDHIPKALVPVAGKPLLEHLLLKLHRSGCNDVVINVHHLAEQIIDYIKQYDTDMHIAISDERAALLNTGGGIKHAQPLLQGTEPFLVHNVDILSNLDLHQFYSIHNPHALATLLVSQRDTTRYLLFDADNRLVGWTNTQTGEVKTPYPNLQVAQCRRRAFAGIHIASPHIFEWMKSWTGAFSIIDFYLSVAAQTPIYGYEPTNLKILDVGKPNTLQAAEMFLTETSSTNITKA